MQEVIVEDIPVMYVQSRSGISGGVEAFGILEGRFKTLKGRKFYGLYHNEVYKACTGVQPADDPKALDLPVASIPGGKYAREKILDWPRHIHLIGPTFDRMMKEVGPRYDSGRPFIEFYRSQKELFLFVPIK